MIPFAKKLATDLVFFASASIVAIEAFGYALDWDHAIVAIVVGGIAALTGAKRVSETPKA